MRKKKKINAAIVLVVLLIVVTLVNIKIHLDHPAYQYYKQNITRLSTEFNRYRQIVNNEIVGKLLIITNLIENTKNQNAFYLQNKEDIKSQNYQIVAPSNYPNFRFDGFFKVGSDSYVSSAGQYYCVGDEINGLRIVSISPQFVQIADRFYSVDKPDQSKIKLLTPKKVTK